MCARVTQLASGRNEIRTQDSWLTLQGFSIVFFQGRTQAASLEGMPVSFLPGYMLTGFLASNLGSMNSLFSPPLPWTAPYTCLPYWASSFHMHVITGTQQSQRQHRAWRRPTWGICREPISGSSRIDKEGTEQTEREPCAVCTKVQSEQTCCPDIQGKKKAFTITAWILGGRVGTTWMTVSTLTYLLSSWSQQPLYHLGKYLS